MAVAIEFQNVKKSFGEKTVLNKISFSIQEGEIVFVIGTSGTGKSVLLKNIVGLLRPEEGRIIVEGRDTTSFEEDNFFEIRKRCGMVFQHPALFDSLTVFENIAFGLRRLKSEGEGDIRRQVSEALALVRLSGMDDKFPNQISYGMQKRVSLARTVAVNPKILLFDEPTTGLDPITTTAVNQLIRSLSRKLKTTSIVVSHDMKAALDIADRIIVLDHGSIVEENTPEKLLMSKHPLVCEFLAEVREAAK